MIKLGVDVVIVFRIARTWSRFQLRFAKKLLHEKELAELLDENLTFKDQVSYLAKKFAAKEAITKAIGIGISSMLSLSKILISHNEFGAPQVNVPQQVLSKIFPSYKTYQLEISISDDYPIVVACAVLYVN
jgi:holo-[acyl-carrier protein] synthase